MDRSQVAAVGLTDANRARMGRPSIRVAPKKSPVGMIVLVAGIGFAIALVTAGGILALRSPPTAAPSASAPPPRHAVEPQVVAGVVLPDPQHVDVTDVLPRLRKRVTAWDADAKLLEITVTHSKGGWVNVNEPGSEIVYKYLSEKRDPRAPKGKEVTRQRLVFALRPGAGEPETVPGTANDKGVADPNCVWSAAYHAALKSGLKAEDHMDVRLGQAPKSDNVVWTFTSGGETRDIDANSCAIRGH